MARTMFPREVQPTLRGKDLKAAKEREALRAKLDPFYITRDQAAAIPQQIVEQTPQLRARIETSRPEWPESRASATIALGELPPGTGETIEERRIESATLFQGQSMRALEERGGE